MARAAWNPIGTGVRGRELRNDLPVRATKGACFALRGAKPYISVLISSLLPSLKVSFVVGSEYPRSNPTSRDHAAFTLVYTAVDASGSGGRCGSAER